MKPTATRMAMRILTLKCYEPENLLLMMACDLLMTVLPTPIYASLLLPDLLCHVLRMLWNNAS
eukprot:SAG31_NODE_1081_length_10014_cov_16.919617_3_plen_63_part_00